MKKTAKPKLVLDRMMIKNLTDETDLSVVQGGAPHQSSDDACAWTDDCAYAKPAPTIAGGASGRTC